MIALDCLCFTQVLEKYRVSSCAFRLSEANILWVSDNSEMPIIAKGPTFCALPTNSTHWNWLASSAISYHVIAQWCTLPMAMCLAAWLISLFFFHSESCDKTQLSNLYHLFSFYTSCISSASMILQPPPSGDVRTVFLFSFPSLSLLIERNRSWKLFNLSVCSPLCFLICEHFLTQLWQ